MEIMRNDTEDLPVARPKSTMEMNDEERFIHYIKLKFPPFISDQLIALYPDFNVEYKSRLKSLYQNRRVFAFFHGDVGTGKTFSAVIAFLLARRGRWAFIKDDFQILKTLSYFTDLQNKVNSPDYFHELSIMKNCPFLIIDDFGLNKLTDWNVMLMSDIIEARYLNRLSTIITSNHTLQVLDQLGYRRLVSRIGDMCKNNIYEFKKNLRNPGSLKSREI